MATGNWVMDMIERKILRMVADGTKIGCYTSGKQVPTKAKELGLECVPICPSKISRHQDYYAVARRCSIDKILPNLNFPTIKVRGVQHRLNLLIKKVRNKTIAETLVILNTYPRIDRRYKNVPTGNLERPEVAILQGALLSFAPCCIEYYFETRYLNYPKTAIPQTVVSREIRLAPRLANHVRCPICTRMTKRAKKQF